MDLYHHLLMEHYRYPRHRGKVEQAHFQGQLGNPLCGDVISWQGTYNDQGFIEQIAFQGKGCVISQALASVIAEHVQKKSREECLRLEIQFFIDMFELKLGLTRFKCAALPLEALKISLQQSPC